MVDAAPEATTDPWIHPDRTQNMTFGSPNALLAVEVGISTKDHISLHGRFMRR